MKIYQNIISDYFYLATIPLLDFNSRGGRWLDHKKHLVNIWWLEWINKWINKRINGYVLVWYNYRFLLFLNMLVQLTKHVVLLFLVQVDWPTVHIYLFSPKMPHYNDNKIMFLKGVKPHEENGRSHPWLTLHFWITNLGEDILCRDGESSRGDSHSSCRTWENLGNRKAQVLPRARYWEEEPPRTQRGDPDTVLPVM